MSYGSMNSKKPFERASKTSHTNIIKDEVVKAFLKKCHIPLFDDNIEDTDFKYEEIVPLESNPIKTIITIDGGYTDVVVKEDYPSSTLAFFQFGVLFFKYHDLLMLHEKPFIDPEDFSKLQNIERIKLVIPTKGISLEGEKDLVSSVRKSIYDFFCNNPKDNDANDKLIEALKWLLYGGYKGRPQGSWHLSACPHCNAGTELDVNQMKNKYEFKCAMCSGMIYLTDVFRLHEVVDNELGAGGILGYLTTTVEQLLVVLLLKSILSIRPSLLSETLIIRDGPLAFFGQTANLHKPMRNLIKHLHENHSINLIGLEKSGAFVEHAAMISNKIEKRRALLINNQYIYKHIIPGKADDKSPYGNTTYYGNKIIYKSEFDNVYVATIPTIGVLSDPKKSDYLNIDILLNNVAALKCDLYYNSLVPIVMANKLVSLADHPSANILRHFARESMDG